jgi:hypothetical protein
VVNIKKKEIITIVLVVLAIAAFIGLSIAFGGGATDGAGGAGGGIPRCH